MSTALSDVAVEIRGPFAGVDVGGRQKGFHCAVLDESDHVVLSRQPTPASVVDWLVGSGVTLVAIESPRSPAPAGHKSRDGERELVAAGVCNLRYTPDRASLDANPRYYEWIEHGLELFDACDAAGIAAIECFPTASWSRWAGPRGATARAAWYVMFNRASGSNLESGYLAGIF